MIYKLAGEAFPDIKIPELTAFYEELEKWSDIFEGRPKWRKVKRSGGLVRGTERMVNMLNTGKILCDEFGHKCFAEQVDITCGNDAYDKYLADFLDREGFWKTVPQLISKAFAHGGCALREYIENGAVRLGYCEARQFIPLRWDNKGITECIFASREIVGRNYYTLFERHYSEGGVIKTEMRLFRSGDKNALGDRVPVSEIYPDMADNAAYPVSMPLFQYFKPDITNSIEELVGNVPLGQSCFETCADTLCALDVAFDSFAREFILGKKRIIVPSSCVQTIIDPETGETKRYFDADDEAFQALKCDEDKDLHIQDNTMELRIQEHVDGINALLNVLCFQVGLSAGSLSFDRAHGVKTATEIISEESKTAQTIRCNKNLLIEFIGGMCDSVLALAMETGEVPRGDYELSVSFRDGIVVDDNTLIDNNIKLVSAGLKSKISAIMEVLKCDEETARQEYEKIISESRVSAGMTDLLALSDKEDMSSEADTVDTEEAVDNAEEAAGKTLNGAQTQSLITVMSQYKAGVLSLGQAVNIVSVAIGISKDEAKKIIEGAE